MESNIFNFLCNKCTSNTRGKHNQSILSRVVKSLILQFKHFQPTIDASYSLNSNLMKNYFVLAEGLGFRVGLPFQWIIIK